MADSAAGCPSCGGALAWEDENGDVRGYFHNADCSHMEGAIPLKIQVGDDDWYEIGRFVPDPGQSVGMALIHFLHATSMMMLKNVGADHAANCLKVTRSRLARDAQHN